MSTDAPEKRSASRSRTSRPTTPLRPSSRSEFRESARHATLRNDDFPLNSFEPSFAELSDAMVDLEANMMHFQLMHESLARFSESFASFLYGLNMNAFCVDFPEAPVAESFQRERKEGEAPYTGRQDHEAEATFMTTDTSFVDNPPVSSKPATKTTTTTASRQSRLPAARGSSTARGRSTTRGRNAPSGLARARPRGMQ